MSTLFYERNPFDILVRNFFQDASYTVEQTKLSHPRRHLQSINGLTFEISLVQVFLKKILKSYFRIILLELTTLKPKEEEESRLYP
jgi:hypothetical protein